MTVVHLSEITWPEAKALGEEGAWVLMPMGSTEAHGPHLPLSTDTILSEEVAVRSAVSVSDEMGCPVVIAPTMPYGVTDFAAPFAGTISLSENTLVQFIEEWGKSLADHGLGRICLINNHLEPGQLRALIEGTRRLNEDPRISAVFANNCSKRWARTLTDEFKSGACHAGQYETSLVLASKPGTVKSALASELKENNVSLSMAIRDGATNFVEAGGPEAYFGFPSDGTAVEGEDTYRLLVEMVVTEIRETVGESE